MPQTKTEIRNLLQVAGLRANRRLGQHFLIDGNLMGKLVDAAEIGPQHVVLEVGAGTGSLTELLLERAGCVVAVEVDGGLFKLLTERLGSHDRLALIHADVLRRKSEISPLVLEGVRAAGAASEGNTSLMMVANLPYSVASPLIIDLLGCGLRFDRMCFTVQSEVAQRMLIDHGHREYGPLSIALQSTCSLEKLFVLPAHVFWPQPNVTSTAMRLDVDMRNFETHQDFGEFMSLLGVAFSHRRKTLHYNLRRHYDENVLQQGCAQADIDPRSRAEQVPVLSWLMLFRALPKTQFAARGKRYD